jgi:hypothetical protein
VWVVRPANEFDAEGVVVVFRVFDGVSKVCRGPVNFE